ncbi:hypothetical protein GOL82_16270 [Sinorhizobium medicae]|nr:hypothetical protein [Sinorhizobium medicae]
MGVFEQKFKVGDRVRRVEPSIWPNDFGVVGEEYTVLDIVEDTGSLVIFEGCKGASQSAFELVEQPWRPKVGDRVQRVKGYNPGSNIGHIATVLEVEDISAYDDEGPWLKFTDGTSGYASSFEPLPVAAEAQPLRIVEGKFYKTRDGRKVGPIGPNEGGLQGYPWQDDSSWSDCWTADGRYYADTMDSSHDLIAEWVDEPAAPSDTVAVAATASNDNEPVASQQAYKVGDKVRSLVDWCDTKAGDILPITTVSENGVWATDRLGDETYLAFDEIEPAPQQPTTGFTIPLVDEDPEPLTVTLSLGADAFHEELDEIIAKLKKIRKLQRQTGLAA